MKNIFKAGDKKIHRFKVGEEDVAAFGGEVVHYVCSTFALAREIEYAARLFLLDMQEEDEKGIGTRLQVEHRSPALVGEELIFEAEWREIKGNEVFCRVRVKAGERLIATAETGQKLVKKDKLDKIFNTILKG